MSLPILVAVVSFGIVLVVALVHLTGGSEVARLDSGDAAQARFALDYPHAEVVGAILTADGRDAVLDLADGDAGLVHAMGARHLTRLLGRETGYWVETVNAHKLVVHPHDFTLPKVSLLFQNDTEAERAAAVLGRHAQRVQERAA